MNNRDLIYQAVEIIEKNLRSNENIYSISQKLGFSVYYFSRLFKGVIGISPKSYMLHRQITKSVQELINSDKKIIDIALDYGFNSSESFSRAFQKLIGSNPSDVRNSGSVNSANLMNPICREKIEHRNKLEKNEPELCELSTKYLVGLPFYYEKLWKNDLANPWMNLMRHIDSIPNLHRPERYYQVQYWFPEQEEGSIYFFVAVEVEKFSDIPMQFIAKTIPAGSYLKFFHHGRSNRVGNTYKYIYEKWLPDSQYKLPHLFNFEFYGDQHKGPDCEDSISEIYIPVSK